MSTIHQKFIYSKKRFILAVLAGIVMVSAYGPEGTAYGKDTSRRIALIESSSQAEFTMAAKSFCNSIGQSDASVSRFRFDSASGTEFWRKVAESNPGLVVTFGTQATKSALRNAYGIPVLYSMTFQEEKDFVSDSVVSREPVAGISLSIPIEKQLNVLKDAIPLAQKIGILYSEKDKSLYERAVKYSENRNVTVVGAIVDDYRKVPAALNRIMDQVDCLLVPPDVNIYQPDALTYILRECFGRGIPVMAFSRQLAMAGASLSIELNYEDIGLQTAELAMNVLGNRSRETSMQQYPRSFRILINEGISSRLGIYFSREILDKAEMVGSGEPER